MLASPDGEVVVGTGEVKQLQQQQPQQQQQVSEARQTSGRLAVTKDGGLYVRFR